MFSTLTVCKRLSHPLLPSVVGNTTVACLDRLRVVYGAGVFMVHSFQRFFLVSVVVTFLSACVTNTFVTEKELSTSEPTILLVQPNVTLSEVSAGGVPTPKADWTEAAQIHIREALKDELNAMGATMELADNFSDTEVDPRETQLATLHSTVGSHIVAYQVNAATRLPTKQEFDWSLGPEVSYYKDRYNSDYALFVHVQDSYASDGRKAAIFMAALLFGVSLQGGIQSAYATLVDLDTGEIVWFNFLHRGQGDLRELEPARETVKTLLTDFPG